MLADNSFEFEIWFSGFLFLGFIWGSEKHLIAGVKHPGGHIKFSLLGDYNQVLYPRCVLMCVENVCTVWAMPERKRFWEVFPKRHISEAFSKSFTSRMVMKPSKWRGWPCREKILWENAPNENDVPECLDWKKSKGRLWNKHPRNLTFAFPMNSIEPYYSSIFTDQTDCQVILSSAL